MTEMASAILSDGPFFVGSHQRPDGDSVGSSLALVRWLRTRGIESGAVFPNGVPAPYASLPGATDTLGAFPSELSDAKLIVVDTPLPERVAGGSSLLERAAATLVIDHHPDNTSFGTVNLVDPTASSAALLVHEVIASVDGVLDPATASLLYLGVMTDTGGFRFGNTDARTLRAAADLVAMGADPAELADTVYGRQPMGRLRLLGMVLSSAETTLDGRVTFLTLSDEMRAATGSTGEEIEGLASYGRLIDTAEVSVLFREEGENVRLSMRSKGRVDVNALAKRLGGGGHRAASGALVAGPLKKARERVLEALEGLLS